MTQETKKADVLSLGLSAVLGGAGAVELAIPGKASELAAFNFFDSKAERAWLMRALGLRDLGLAAAFFATRDKPKQHRLLLEIFTGCMIFDTTLCVLALRKPGATKITLAATLNSIAFMVIGFWGILSKKNS